MANVSPRMTSAANGAMHVQSSLNFIDAPGGAACGWKYQEG
jgi:hypothetical protein